jgi:hypothetical protein
MTQDQNEPYEEAGLIKSDEDVGDEEERSQRQGVTKRISEEIEKRVSGSVDEGDR